MNNMTPREKAKELVDKYLRTYPIYNNPTVVISYTHNEAKQCALIAVDEILDLNLGLSNCDENNWEIEEFYSEVKTEIQKL
jgi:hypothetical protein